MEERRVFEIFQRAAEACGEVEIRGSFLIFSFIKDFLAHQFLMSSGIKEHEYSRKDNKVTIVTDSYEFVTQEEIGI